MQTLKTPRWPEGVPTGKAVVTTGGKLRVKLAIHTVGPVWRGGEHGEPERLAEAYRNCFALAASKGPKSIAVPSISTDTCGYPVEKASRIALETTKVSREDAES